MKLDAKPPTTLHLRKLHFIDDNYAIVNSMKNIEYFRVAMHCLIYGSADFLKANFNSLL